MLVFDAIVCRNLEERPGRVAAADVAESDGLDAMVGPEAANEYEGLQILRIPIIHDGGEGLFVSGECGGNGSGLPAVAKGLAIEGVRAEILGFGVRKFGHGASQVLEWDLLQARPGMEGNARFLVFETSIGERGSGEERNFNFSWSVVNVDGDLCWVVWIAQHIEIDNGADASVRVAGNFSGEAMDEDGAFGRKGAVFDVDIRREGNPGQRCDSDAGEGVIRGLDEAGEKEWFVGRLKDSLCLKRV